MKRLNKKSVILAALGLLIGSGAYLNYQMSKTDTTGMSELTLANLEAMAWELDGELDMDGEGGGKIECYGALSNAGSGSITITKCSTCMDETCSDYSNQSKCKK